MPRRSETHHYCSSCARWHRYAGGPCETCFEFKCPRCGAWSPVGSPCRSCGLRVGLSRRTVREMTHPRGISFCPRCGRRFRKSARDKRRAYRLKG